MKQEGMSTVGYDETFSDDIRALCQFRGKQMKDGNGAIAIFQQDDNWFAFGDDADKLFERMGWQTSAKLMDEGVISWMDVNESGIMALKLNGIEVTTLDPKFGVNIVGWSSEEDYKADCLSLAQQTIAALCGDRDISFDHRLCGGRDHIQHQCRNAALCAV